MQYGKVQYLNSSKISDNTSVNEALWCYRDAHKSYFPDALNMLLLLKSRHIFSVFSNKKITTKIVNHNKNPISV